MMDTAYQNQGIGTQIIQEAVEAMKKRRLSGNRLGVDYGNRKASRSGAKINLW